MPVEITDADEISRCIIFDRAFEQEMHVDHLLWRFESKTDDGVYHESAILRRLAPLQEDVHRIGCQIAAAQNERKPHRPGPKRRYYCGFRTAAYRTLPKEGEGFRVAFIHDEKGDVAHVDVALTVTVEGKNARATCRTDAGLSLAEQFGKPSAHRCECDEGDEHHPFSLWGEGCLTDGLRDRWPALVLTDGEQEAGEDDIARLF